MSPKLKNLLLGIASFLLIFISLNNYLFPRCGCASICFQFYETPLKYVGREYWTMNTYAAIKYSQTPQSDFGPLGYGCIGRSYGFVYVDLLVLGGLGFVYTLFNLKKN
jgi:hypothetical protein